jgi:predicted transcriptional regulator
VVLPTPTSIAGTSLLVDHSVKLEKITLTFLTDIVDRNSVYSNEWCNYVSGQMHEIGHNLVLPTPTSIAGTSLLVDHSVKLEKITLTFLTDIVDRNSVYSNEWCNYVSGQMHEIGHNLNFAHSSK